MSRRETIREACLRARELPTRDRNRIWARAIDRGVTFRELAELVDRSPSSIHSATFPHVRKTSALDEIMDAVRNQP